MVLKFLKEVNANDQYCEQMLKYQDIIKNEEIKTIFK